MGALDGLLDQVKQAITNHAGDSTQGFDASKLLGHISDLFGNHPANQRTDVKPASQDPYGDPGQSGVGTRNVKPASADPYGDPGDDTKRR